MMMENTVYTVTLNPALDCFLRPERFAAGEINRYHQGAFYPGGKGVNVSLLLRGLGIRTVAMGIGAGLTGRGLTALLEQAGCPADFIQLEEGMTRVNMKITPGDGPETALNGSGPEVPPEALDRLAEKLRALRPGDYLVLAGSLPGSVPADVYARLLRAVPAGVRTAVDTSGPALVEAVKAEPFFIKPNLDELGEIFGRPIPPEEALHYARRLREMGARNVAVSMGSGGAALLTEDGRAFRREALSGVEVSSVGAGDSFVAGFLYGWMETGGYEAALDWAMAAGAATAFTEGIASGGQVRNVYRKFS